jgi:hypothetical protein
MQRKCFTSFKTEDIDYKNYMCEHLSIDMIDKSLHEPISSINEDYIMRMIRQDYLCDSTVTIHLIGTVSSENRGAFEQRFIKRELQASLYHGDGNSQNGILAVALPDIVSQIFGAQYICGSCGGYHNYVGLNDTTVVKEISYNYYIPNSSGTKCSWQEEDRYCVLVKWDDFISNPELYIEQAFQKRFSEISNKTKVRP